MKTSKRTSHLLKAGAILSVLGMAYFTMPTQSKASNENKLTMEDLQLISIANAEGTVKCSGPGSGCKITVNGVPGEASTHKE